jgi:hypothetical protein
MGTAIYIMSCDKNIDILNHSILSFEKYMKNVNLKWYIGVNSDNNTFDDKYLKLFSNKSNWREESLNQINQIRNENNGITHLIVILDDFILKNNLNVEILYSLLQDEKIKDINYLRLKRIEESILKNIFINFLPKVLIGKSKIFKIRKTHPYYYSLQIAIWNIDYLYDSILNSQDIWHFENQQPTSIDHWSVTNNIFEYKHVVEKGKWEHYAKTYCWKYINYFQPGARQIINNNFKNRTHTLLKKIKFLLIGYVKLTNK